MLLLSQYSFRPQKQQGIALIQVLLITAILSVLAIYLTNTAKEQVKIAQWTDDKSQALVSLHSAEAQLLFSLLTQQKIVTSENNADGNRNGEGDISGSNEESITQRWNFFAKPFFVTEQVMVSIQDQAGLIHAQYPDRDVLEKLFLGQGLGMIEVNELIDNLLDWQDLDSISRANGAETSVYAGLIRNGAIPDVHDFSFIKKITPELLELLINTTTIYRQGSFNPTNAPTEILHALTNESAAKQVILLRESGQLTKRNFSQLTGIVEDDDTFFYPSNFLSIKLTSKIGESKVHKEMTIQVRPYAKADKSPINFFSNRG